MNASTCPRGAFSPGLTPPRALHHHDLVPESPRLSQADIVAFVNIVDKERARAFYGDVLGLDLIGDESPFALVYDANGTMLRLAIVKERPEFPGTVLGWRVFDIGATVKELVEAGVRFERYPPMPQDELGIWTTPTGAKVAWFKDPDGNILSVSQHPERAR
jgi:catechol 2,3-dioxygenase-like lactoylglutathione lyase family enzyme